MESVGSDIVMNCLSFRFMPWRPGISICLFIIFGIYAFNFAFVEALRPLRETSHVWGDEWLVVRNDDNQLDTFTAWNITGSYKGSLRFLHSSNISSRFPGFNSPNGNVMFQVLTTPTKVTGVHYAEGVIVFHDVFGNEDDAGVASIMVEGVYIWPFRQLRMVASGRKEGEITRADNNILPAHYSLLGVFSSQLFQQASRYKKPQKVQSSIYRRVKHCNIEIAAKISRHSSANTDINRESYHMEGLVESPSVRDDMECLSPLLLNATSTNIEVYYNKAVNYVLMVTFISFLQVILLIRQMEYSNTQSGVSRVSILMIGQQAILDAYLCLLHLTAGILVESLFNPFATAVFFKFVVFSIFEMRYLLGIWKATRSANIEGWEAVRRDLSVLYTRFYGILLGGIILVYEFHYFLRHIIFLLYSFWIPQIVMNLVHDSRKPLHPLYILGMTIARLIIPFYAFGCPENFVHVAPDLRWCGCLGLFVGIQAIVLLLQHYFGPRCFIPHQMLPKKYCYYRRSDDVPRQSDCVICIASVGHGQPSNDRMVTPCGHFFHSGCLQRWMDVKMECPTCRRSLPPV